MNNNNYEIEKKENVFKLKTSGEAFSLAVFFILLFSLILQGIFFKKTTEELNSSKLYLFLSYFLASGGIAVSLLVCKKLSGYNPILAYRKCGFSPMFFIIIVAVFLGMIFGLGWINDTFISLLKKIGYNENVAILPEKSFCNVLLCIIFICIIPAIMEETLFRGVILNGLKPLGEINSILVSAMLFSIFHMSPEKTLYQFAAGLLFALVTIKSGSVLPSILIHFLNNFFVILNYYYFNFSPKGKTLIILVVIGIISLLSALILLITKPEIFNKSYQKINKNIPEGGVKMFIFYAITGIIVCLIIWIAGFISYV